MKPSSFERIHQVVKRIPPGQVATYGQIARLAGMPRGARTVGWALRAIPEGSSVPWHRVVNAQGTISLDPQGASIQRDLLEAEGIVFDKPTVDGRIDLKQFGWAGLDLAERQQLVIRPRSASIDACSPQASRPAESTDALLDA